MRHCAKYITVLLLLVPLALAAQDDLLSFDDVKETRIVESAFNGSNIVNSQSTNLLGIGRLNFLISHRFGTVNEGAYNLFGLDFSSVRLGLEYGLVKNLAIGIGRSSLGKNYDGSLKYRFFTQTEGERSIPFSLVLFSSAAFSSVDVKMNKDAGIDGGVGNHLVYTTQALISREFSTKLSLQIMPTFIHRNRVLDEDTDNDIYSFGFGMRFKVSRKVHLSADYYYRFNSDENRDTYDPLALGVDIVTGGHVFKVYLTNSAGMIEKEFITNTVSNFFDGDIRIGFTVLRSFVLKPEVKGGKIL